MTTGEQQAGEQRQAPADTRTAAWSWLALVQVPLAVRVRPWKQKLQVPFDALQSEQRSPHFVHSEAPGVGLNSPDGQAARHSRIAVQY